MRRARAILVTVILALSLAACQAMFTTSLGTAFERDKITIPADISAADAQTILDDPDTSPAAYAALLVVLNDQVATNPAAAGLALTAAVGASQLETNLADPLNDILKKAIGGTSPTPAEMSAIVTALQKTDDNTEVAAALARLDSGGGSLDADVLAASGLSPTNVLLVALVIASSALGPGEDPTDPGFDAAAYQLTPQAMLAADLLSAAASELTNTELLDSISQYFPVTP